MDSDALSNDRQVPTRALQPMANMPHLWEEGTSNSLIQPKSVLQDGCQCWSQLSVFTLKGCCPAPGGHPAQANFVHTLYLEEPHSGMSTVFNALFQGRIPIFGNGRLWGPAVRDILRAFCGKSMEAECHYHFKRILMPSALIEVSKSPKILFFTFL